MHGTCQSVPGTAWHVPCTILAEISRGERREEVRRTCAREKNDERGLRRSYERDDSIGVAFRPTGANHGTVRAMCGVEGAVETVAA